MEKMRTPFQGLWNIVRFNWHFYVAAAFSATLAVSVVPILGVTMQWLIVMIVSAFLIAVSVSLGVSYYIYDCSDLYDLPWIDELNIKSKRVVVNVSAGFDETTEILKTKIPGAELHIWDFYDPQWNTEISIKRARSAYPSPAQTQSVQIDDLPMENGQADLICLHLAAHEIRKREQRLKFFTELHRVLRDNGSLCVTEHLRDLPNFLVYNIGALHFYSKNEWFSVFQSAGFIVALERKETPFLSTFVLNKNDQTR